METNKLKKNSAFILPDETRIGHIHLKVANIDRSLEFYCDLLGFSLVMRLGNQAAFVSAGGYHHHIGLNTWHSQNGPAPAPYMTGLYHAAILVPDRKTLAELFERLMKFKYPISGTADHGVSEAIYLNDPDGNGLEFYYDRPREEWPLDETGNLTMYTRALDLDSLFSELDK